VKNILVRILFKLLKIKTNFLNDMVSHYVGMQCKTIGKNAAIEYPISTLGLSYISIGDNFNVRKDFKLRAHQEYENIIFSPVIIIGDNFYAGTQSYISIIGKLVLGNNVTLASRVTIIDHAHGKSDYSDIEIPVMKRELSIKGPIIIEDNVWICEGAVILSGITIGKNSIIAANAVVTKNVSSNSIVAGVPARVVKTLNC
jgi:acetyltransferase-like isoleucine patch superfamily enzyme